MVNNRVREVFVARIKGLMAQYEESKAIDHGPTVGAMREGYLRRFIRELMPPKFAPVSGFIADMKKNTSPQLDMIFLDRSELPTVALLDDIEIVPFEIALLTAEVKSTLRTQDLEQTRTQRDAILSMESDFMLSSPYSTRKRIDGRNKVGMMLLAFECEVAEERLEQWVREMHDPAGVCILSGDKGPLSIFDEVITQTPREITTLRASDSNDPEPVLAFVGAMYRSLYYLQLFNSTATDQELQRTLDSHALWLWECYLSEHHVKHVSKFRQGDSH